MYPCLCTEQYVLSPYGMHKLFLVLISLVMLEKDTVIANGPKPRKEIAFLHALEEVFPFESALIDV